jgi:hypothetical protein
VKWVKKWVKRVKCGWGSVGQGQGQGQAPLTIPAAQPTAAAAFSPATCPTSLRCFLDIAHTCRADEQV